MIRVFKFGGASVKDAPAVRNMAQIVGRFSSEFRLLVVVSAMGKTTNNLEKLYSLAFNGQDWNEHFEVIKNFHIEIAQKLFPDVEAPIFPLLEKLFERLSATLRAVTKDQDSFDEGYDQIISFGEIISTHLIAHYLRTLDTNAVWLDARQYIQTDNTWREGKIDWVWTNNLIGSELSRILENHTIITQGFIGGTVENKTTTLGREGSDFSAAIFAAGLKAEKMVIWKDVPGVLSADPKLFENPQLIESLSYSQAAEMTYYGATVIHPKTIRPLALGSIPLEVKSFVNPDAIGTTISIDTPEQESKIPTIIVKPEQGLLKLTAKDYSFVSEDKIAGVLQTLARLNIGVNLLQTSAIGVSIVTNYREQQAEIIKRSFSNSFECAYSNGFSLFTFLNPLAEIVNKSLNEKVPIIDQMNGTTRQILVKD